MLNRSNLVVNKVGCSYYIIIQNLSILLLPPYRTILESPEECCYVAFFEIIKDRNGMHTNIRPIFIGSEGGRKPVFLPKEIQQVKRDSGQ